MTNLKKVFLVMLVVILLGATVAFATDDTIIITPQTNTVIGGSENTASTNTIQITDTNTVSTNVVLNASSNTSNTSTYSNTTTLPQTGANDYAIMTIIAILAVLAVYAYKKIRDYKNI